MIVGLSGNIVYISGPISETKSAEVTQRLFDDAEALLKNNGYMVLNPLDIPPPPSWIKDEWAYYMKLALPMVLRADCIYVLEGWSNSKGSKLELHVAERLGINVFYSPRAEAK